MDSEKRWWGHYRGLMEIWQGSRSAATHAWVKQRAKGVLKLCAFVVRSCVGWLVTSASSLRVVCALLAVSAAAWLAAGPAGLALRDATDRLRSGQLLGDSLSDGERFDYIVVGAGAAGSAVAARLALAGMRVLLLEAGGDPGFVSKMPGAAMTLPLSSVIGVKYDTLSNNKSCLSNEHNSCRFIRGRGVGGSTGLNFMMYTRGNRRDYEYGLPGWSWAQLRPYFLRSEGLYDLRRLPAASARHHNTSGLIPVGFFGDDENPWRERLVAGLRALRVPHNRDVNAASQIGVSRVLGYTAGGERVNTAGAYLAQPGVRGRLRLAKRARCTGVIVDERNVARGVTVARAGHGHAALRVFARHEVVLSAGAVATPQLLMLSGVGPRQHLQELGIPVKADLPVGEGMSDHVVPVVYVQVDDESKSTSLLSAIGSKSLQAVRWLATRGGPMASIDLTDLTTFINTMCYDFTRRRLVNDEPECELPSLQFIHAYIQKGFGRLVRSAIQTMTPMCDDIFEEIIARNDDRSFLLISPVLLQPASRGWVRLASADPLAEPAIAPNYLDDERDVRELVRALVFLEHVLQTPVFRKHNATIVRPAFPACPGASGRRYWACYARHMTQSVQHAVGTAALGRVLDERLRVRGVARLRVADAAALPTLPRGNTAAAVIAFGERLAHFLLQDHEPHK